MTKRILVSIPLLGLMVLLILDRSIFFFAILILLCCIAMLEMVSAFKNASYMPSAWTSLAFALLMYPVHALLGLKLVLILFVVMNILALVYAVLHPERQFLDIIISSFILIYPALPFYFLMLIGDMESCSLSLVAMGITLLIPVANDTAAYFIGKFFGKTKLSPRISPNKTVEGSIGGFSFALFIAVIGTILVHRYAVIDIPWYHILICATIGSIFAQTGDLAASAIKRFTGIKDFGTIFPGHGGIMDRADSILMCGVAVYTYFSIFVF